MADPRRGARLDRRASSSDCEGAPGAGGGPGLGPGLGHGRAVERGGSGVSTSGRMDSGSIELPVLPWVDWQIPAEEIRICRRPNGAEWELGSGAFGKARSPETRKPSPVYIVHCSTLVNECMQARRSATRNINTA